MHLGTQHHLHGHGVEYEKHARRQIFYDADAEQKKKTKKTIIVFNSKTRHSRAFCATVVLCNQR